MRLWREYLKTDAQLRNEPNGAEPGDEQLLMELRVIIFPKIPNTVNTGNSVAKGQRNCSVCICRVRIRCATLHPMYYAKRRGR